MYRIRFHGRGGQGIKTASRLLGTAFFREGFQVQDAPRYGAERRGAPIFAYVRAARNVIHERGVIHHPDLVVVVDDTLLALPAAGVLEGVTDRTLLLVNSRDPPERWRERVGAPASILVLDALGPSGQRGELPYQAAACAGAAARLSGVVSREALRAALDEELAGQSAEVLAENLERALAAYDHLGEHAGALRESEPPAMDTLQPAQWVELIPEPAHLASPTIFPGITSTLSHTGLWRTQRPVIDPERCKHCWWVCTTFCPDNAVQVVDGGLPAIDYDHCKGCMICLEQCPPQAITAVDEPAATS